MYLIVEKTAKVIRRQQVAKREVTPQKSTRNASWKTQNVSKARQIVLHLGGRWMILSVFGQSHSGRRGAPRN
jgi:hypothetical protein